MASSDEELQIVLEEVVASTTGTLSTLPVYDDREQFFALPFVISATEWTHWRAASEYLIRCIHRYVSRRYSAEGKPFLLSLGVQPEQLELLSLAGPWPSLKHTMARPDFLQGPNGPLFMEANIDSSLGGLGTADPLCRIVGQCSTVTRYMGDVSRSTNLIPTFANQIRDIVGMSTDAKVSMLIVDWQDEIDEAPWPYAWLARDLEHHGIHATIRSEISFRQNETRDLIYRGTTPVDKLWKRMNSFNEVWETGGAGVPILSSLWDVVLSSKAVLGEMWCSLEQQELDPDDAEFVRTHVLWTWPIGKRECVRSGRTLELLDFAVRMRSELVLKSPSDGSCKNVVIGKYCNDESWIKALSKATQKMGYILQQYQEPTLRWSVDRTSSKVSWSNFRCVDSVFVFGGRASGTCIRGNSIVTPYISCMHGAREGIALAH